MLMTGGALTVPALGMGTWHMGARDSARAGEVAALRAGVDAGLTLIDTAEMYDDAEVVVGEAIKGRRDGLFLVSKVLPSNASYDGILQACDRSRERMGVDIIDLYLLHWSSSHPMDEIIDAFETLRARQAITHWGVSNFDAGDMTDVLAQANGENCAANQIYYSLGARGPEFDLLPMLRDRNIATMAYCPLDEGKLAKAKALKPVAKRHGASCAQIALAWLLHQPGVIVIPKSSSEQRTRENAAARELALTDQDLAEIDAAFAPPTRKQSLKIV